MKKVSILPVEDPSLADKVARLRIVGFPHFPEVLEFDFYDFVYGKWYASHPLADQVYRWAAVTNEGEAVGHLSALPQYYRINGKRVVAHTPSDYMVHPQYGFYALSLMRTFFRRCENCVACDMVPATIGVETRLGAEVAGQLQYALKLLNVSRLPMPPAPEPLRKLLNLPDAYGPAPVRGYPGQEEGNGRVEVSPDLHDQEAPPAQRPRLPFPEPVKGLLNGGLRTVDEALGAAFAGGLEAEVLDGFDDSFDALFEKVAASTPCIPEKDAAFLRWRYGPGSPQNPVTVLGVRRGGELLGYAVLKVVAGMDGYILDLVALPGRGDVARALVRASVRALREMGAHIVRYRHNRSPSSASHGDLRRLGFFHRQGRRNSLLTKFSDPDQHKVARHIANWTYIVGDGEATFWMR